MKLRYLAIFFFLITFQTLNAKELKKITLQLSWFDQFQFAGYYMAKQKGFYEDAGLDVEIKPFSFGRDIPKEVNDGNVDFAVGRETLILDRSNNRNIVVLYALFQATPLVLLSTQESRIDSISKFKNRRIMTTIDDSSEVSLKAMINSHNIQMSDLSFVKHSHNIMDLVNKKVDVMSAYLSKTPYDLQQMGVKYHIFDPKKYGFDMYSDFLYTSDEMLHSDPNTVFLFKQASLRGWEYAYSNINESVDVIYEHYNSQNLTKEALQFEAEELKKLSYFGTSNLGEIQEDKLQRIYDLYNVMGLVKNQIQIKDFLAQNNFSTSLIFSQKEQEYLAKKERITMCMIPNVMPYGEMKNGHLIGFFADYVKLLEQKLNVHIDPIQTNSMVQTIEYLKNKKCEIIPGAQITQERKSYLNFTKPYLKIPFVLITQEDKPFITDLHMIQEKRLSMVSGYAITDLIKRKYQDFEFKEVKSIQEAFREVQNGNVYGTIAPLAVALYLIEKNHFKNLKISAKLDEVNYLRMSVVKDDVVLYSILDKVINSIDSSVIDSILNKWLYKQEESDFNYRLLLQMFLFFALVIAAILYRQHLLKKVNKSLTEKVNEKTKELQKINSELEMRIEKEVEKNLKKDRILSRQSKMAAMGEMIENIAHQWRQPLSIISTSASGMRLKKELSALDDKHFYEMIDTINNTVHYLSTTIDDFRYFFKPNKDKAFFSLKRCCERSLELLKPKLQNIELVLDLEEVQHFGFENEMVQVFMNIISNAKDALEHSKVQKKYIFITIHSMTNGVEIEIKDNAGGIPETILNKVSEPYFTTKHKSQGTGIGLYMCEEIISKHMGGKMEVNNQSFLYENTQYNGALFTIYLYND
ncbi:ABC transporter substrate-binding protein [Candidatus Marinarcus aquaticus]|uniref:histidine kinase n=1 Tax=Candidatus Marinarcus aquaticus TaxID=2044504 RepID=A0A4Q0XP82_9BACT|nr:ABC transporter substrate-binding protein [Candidatus Marinarcus aquaticus]RXJ54583.1 histidine kinase [Candidatus Marinarcus aquaticus]